MTIDDSMLLFMTKSLNLAADLKKMSESLMAQRNLSKFLFQMGAIQSFHAGIEAFHKMFKLGVGMDLILPQFPVGLLDNFNTMDKDHKG